ncbi:hypothetical protein HMN09_00290700 [Mycena chlorophos]|uniref:Uncharacterized protein n=1 Tax=Mycena chlorophos TaxID=658473 RepID=A0A8H6TL16_MYCCL|nr:hypothetical protein HMN09_00290700 [Mycena chlorophos]
MTWSRPSPTQTSPTPSAERTIPQGQQAQSNGMTSARLHNTEAPAVSCHRCPPSRPTHYLDDVSAKHTTNATRTFVGRTPTGAGCTRRRVPVRRTELIPPPPPPVSTTSASNPPKVPPPHTSSSIHIDESPPVPTTSAPTTQETGNRPAPNSKPDCSKVTLVPYDLDEPTLFLRPTNHARPTQLYLDNRQRQRQAREKQQRTLLPRTRVVLVPDPSARLCQRAELNGRVGPLQRQAARNCRVRALYCRLVRSQNRPDPIGVMQGSPRPMFHLPRDLETRRNWQRVSKFWIGTNERELDFEQERIPTRAWVDGEFLGEWAVRNDDGKFSDAPPTHARPTLALGPAAHVEPSPDTTESPPTQRKRILTK